MRNSLGGQGTVAFPSCCGNYLAEVPFLVLTSEAAESSVIVLGRRASSVPETGPVPLSGEQNGGGEAQESVLTSPIAVPPA